jgi:hypothetical protein
MIMNGLIVTVLLLIECKCGWIAMGVLYDGKGNKDALVALLNSLYECSWQCSDWNDIIGLI